VLSQWTVVASVAGIGFLIGGSSAVAIGLLIGPMMTEFAWPNGVASSAATAFNLSALLAAPIVGAVLDKVGARLVMSFGVLAVSSGFLLVSRCHTRYEMLAAFVFIGIGYCASSYVPSAVVVANWMKEKKSIGMGVVWGATSVGAALFSLLIGSWIEAYGWRVMSAIIAALTAVMLSLTLLTIRTNPPGDTRSEYRGLEFLNTNRPAAASWFSSVFIVATASSAFFAIGMNGIYYHVVSLLIKAGFSTRWAGFALGVSWVLSALGSLVLGAIADRLGAKTILAGALCSCALGTLFLIGAGETRIGILCVVAFVVLWGTSANCINQFIPVIFADRFGTIQLGTLIGVQASIMGVVGSGAPIVTGALYDRFGDYHSAIYLSTAATFLSFVLVSLLRVPQRIETSNSRVLSQGN
jgi:MFS family permease